MVSYEGDYKRKHGGEEVGVTRLEDQFLYI